MIDSFKSKTAGNIFFVLVFVALFFFYGLNESLFYPPQSVHIWRQTNCISIAQNYYQHNLLLLEPEIHNQFCDGGTSGKAVGEFPIIYFTVAKLWKVFGKHEWIFKLVQISFLFIGLYALFLFLRRILKDQFLAGFASLLVFTSPMIIFYGPNFLPDVPALSFIFMSWFFTHKFLDKKKSWNLWVAAIFFCIAMLLKITSAISFIAFGGWIIFELLFLSKSKRIFNFQLKHLLPFLIIIIPVVLWYWYADYYNQIHRGHFSFHGIWPIWDMTKEQLARIIDALDKIYFKELFLPFTQYFTFAIWIYLMVIIGKLKPVYRFLLVVLSIGFLIQMMLWFQVLEGHDYYMINLVVVFVAVWAIFLLQVSKVKSNFKYLMHGFLLLFFLYNVITCKERAEGRYNSWMNDMYNKNMKAFIDIEPWFEKWGIGKDDKVISIPDFTINGSLYFMNRKGYTEFGSDFSKAETFYERIEQGAKYLIVNDSMVLFKEYLKPFIHKQIGEYENVLVFDIRDIKSE